MIMIIFLLLCLTLYFLPTIVAGFRHHASFMSIGVINLFLGWTFLFWVLALAWAYTNRGQE